MQELQLEVAVAPQTFFLPLLYLKGHENVYLCDTQTLG